MLVDLKYLLSYLHVPLVIDTLYINLAMLSCSQTRKNTYNQCMQTVRADKPG